jgi:hypothetical protein
MAPEILDSYLSITRIESEMMQRRIDGEQVLQNMIGEKFRNVTPYIAGKGAHGGCTERIMWDIQVTDYGDTA